MTSTYKKQKQARSQGSSLGNVVRGWNCRSIGSKTCFKTFGWHISAAGKYHQCNLVSNYHFSLQILSIIDCPQLLICSWCSLDEVLGNDKYTDTRRINIWIIFWSFCALSWTHRYLCVTTTKNWSSSFVSSIVRCLVPLLTHTAAVSLLDWFPTSTGEETKRSWNTNCDCFLSWYVPTKIIIVYILSGKKDKV